MCDRERKAKCRRVIERTRRACRRPGPFIIVGSAEKRSLPANGWHLRDRENSEETFGIGDVDASGTPLRVSRPGLSTAVLRFGDVDIRAGRQVVNPGRDK